jgi:hypothetical protein
MEANSSILCDLKKENYVNCGWEQDISYNKQLMDTKFACQFLKERDHGSSTNISHKLYPKFKSSRKQK